MYNNKKIIAFIPARIGSKRVPHKNLLSVSGKPLFMYSVDCAKKSSMIDDIFVSSDSEEILEIARKNGCIVNDLRPKKLSDDKARIVDAIIYELSLLKQKYDAIVLLQPTFPLRPENIVDEALIKYFEKETSLITVTKSTIVPEFIRYVDNEGNLCKILNKSSDIRTQDFNQYYKIAGSVYINNLNLINRSTILNENEIPFVIDEYYALDIDTQQDIDELNKRLLLLK